MQLIFDKAVLYPMKNWKLDSKSSNQAQATRKLWESITEGESEVIGKSNFHLTGLKS